ncbi:TetR/AcrR family transcriptional regulator [Blastococcus sp. SYSU DS0619]
MGRPSLAAERTEQIVMAATRCVTRVGFDGTTLEDISQESGLSRGHIRHYVGSRDDLMVLVWARISESFLSALKQASAGASERRIGDVLDVLLGSAEVTDDGPPHVGELLLGGIKDDVLRPKLDRTLVRTQQLLGTMLDTVAPQASDADRAATVQGLMCLALGSSGIAVISGRRRADGLARVAAERLVRSLQRGGALVP